MVRYWIKDYKYTTVTGEVIIEPDVYVIKDEDFKDAPYNFQLMNYVIGNASEYYTHCDKFFINMHGAQGPRSFHRSSIQSSPIQSHSYLFINCNYLRFQRSYDTDLIQKIFIINNDIFQINYIIHHLFRVKLNNFSNIKPIKSNNPLGPCYINGVEIISPTSYNNYEIGSLKTKLSKLMAYLSIPKCVIEDDPVEEEDDSSLSEVDKLIKENAKLKKMLGLA